MFRRVHYCALERWFEIHNSARYQYKPRDEDSQAHFKSITSHIKHIHVYN